MASLDESHQNVEGSRANLCRLPVDQQLPSLRLNNKPAETTLDQCIHASKIQRRSACARSGATNKPKRFNDRSAAYRIQDDSKQLIQLLIEIQDESPSFRHSSQRDASPLIRLSRSKNQNMRENYMKNKLHHSFYVVSVLLAVFCCTGRKSSRNGTRGLPEHWRFHTRAARG